MKTLFSNKTRESLDLAKNILYSLKVVMIGLFVPFLFVFGITYHTPREASKEGINISSPQRITTDKITVDFNNPSSDQNS